MTSPEELDARERTATNLTSIAQAVWDATRQRGLTAECCIAACAAARRLLRSRGYTSDPVPVRVFAATSRALDLLDRGLMPPWENEPTAWTLGVDERMPPEDARSIMGPRARALAAANLAYNGHLVLRVRTPLGPYLFDPSAPQFARPQYGLDVGVVVVGPAESLGLPGRSATAGPGDGRWRVTYEVIPRPVVDYRTTPDWSPQRAKALASHARTLLAERSTAPAP